MPTHVHFPSLTVTRVISDDTITLRVSTTLYSYSPRFIIYKSNSLNEESVEVCIRVHCVPKGEKMLRIDSVGWGYTLLWLYAYFQLIFKCLPATNSLRRFFAVPQECTSFHNHGFLIELYRIIFIPKYHTYDLVKDKYTEIRLGIFWEENSSKNLQGIFPWWYECIDVRIGHKPTV